MLGVQCELPPDFFPQITNFGYCEMKSIGFPISDAASVVSVRPGGSLTGQYGGEVELQCEGSGSPEPELSWQQTSARGVAGRSVFRFLKMNMRLYLFWLFRGVGGRLTISGLQYEDQGEYTCLAENSVGQERSPPVSLSVIGPPRVALAHIGGVQLLEGGDAVLEVEWCAAPFPRQVRDLNSVIKQSLSLIITIDDCE